jgi:hypothetical protein
MNIMLSLTALIMPELQNESRHHMRSETILESRLHKNLI